MSSVDIFLTIAALIGGLALFLFGMSTMSDSLTQMTGGLLDRLIGKITKNRFYAFLFGAILTAIVQSCSATTVLTVGLVNSGLMELSQAIGVIIGANLGTTATSWLLSLNALDGASLLMTIIKPSSFSPFLALAGVFMTMFAKSDLKKNIGYALLGFAVMMMGMNYMSKSMTVFQEMPEFRNILVSFSNPILGFVISLLFTMLIQSSDATIGILMAFALSTGITFSVAIPLVCGAHVGTCITALISSMGASNNGRRTALINLTYNLLKTLPFMIVFYLINGVVHFSFMEESVGTIGIPIFHTLLNLLGSVVWLPGANLIIAFVKKILPLNEAEKEEQANVLPMLDTIFLSNPSFALDQADKALILLAQTAGETFSALINYSQIPNPSDKIKQLCNRTNAFRDQIEKYLIEIAKADLSDNDAARSNFFTTVNRAFGRVGNISEQTMEMLAEITKLKGSLSEAEQTESLVLGTSLHEIVDVTITGFTEKMPRLSDTVQLYREIITELCELIKMRTIRRFHQSNEKSSIEVMLVDIWYSEEKLMDHCDTIANAVKRYSIETGTYTQSSEEEIHAMRLRIKALFKDKFIMLMETQK